VPLPSGLIEDGRCMSVLGRLPARYQLTSWIAGLLTCTGFGAWLALTTPLPMMWSSGAAGGAALGVLAVAAFLHLLDTSPGGRPAGRSH
jgi:hypothetical protein